MLVTQRMATVVLALMLVLVLLMATACVDPGKDTTEKAIPTRAPETTASPDEEDKDDEPSISIAEEDEEGERFGPFIPFD